MPYIDGIHNFLAVNMILIQIVLIYWGLNECNDHLHFHGAAIYGLSKSEQQLNWTSPTCVCLKCCLLMLDHSNCNSQLWIETWCDLLHTCFQDIEHMNYNDWEHDINSDKVWKVDANFSLKQARQNQHNPLAPAGCGRNNKLVFFELISRIDIMSIFL